MVSSSYKENLTESWQRIFEYVKSMYPEAEEQQIKGLLK